MARKVYKEYNELSATTKMFAIVSMLMILQFPTVFIITLIGVKLSGQQFVASAILLVVGVFLSSAVLSMTEVADE